MHLTRRGSEKMSEIIGVRFKKIGKVYYFINNKQKLNVNDLVIVETPQGKACGRVVITKPKNIVNIDQKMLHKVIQKANESDIEQLKKNKEKEFRAKKICNEKIKKHRLDMRLIEVECAFDNSKISFYFTSETRVDFRNLVKELAGIFKTRIELRQVGVRDEAKSLGGIGPCGKSFCCSTFLSEFQPVSIRMAKDQGLSLNPAKISGTCGRLMCCLKYEQDVYRDLLKKFPKIGAVVDTPNGKGRVVAQNLLKKLVSVHIDSESALAPVWFKIDEIKIR